MPEVMKKLIANGIMTSLNASLDFDTASLIAEDLGNGTCRSWKNFIA